MRFTVFCIACFLLSFQGYGQNITLRNGKVYSDKKVILKLAILQKDRIGFSVQTLKGDKLVDIYKAYIDRGDEVGYVIKFLDDNTTFIAYRAPNDDLFFENIVEEIVLTGAIRDGHIDQTGKQTYLKKHGVELQTCRSDLHIKY